MKKHNLAIIAIAAGLAVSAATSQAALSLNVANVAGTGIQFNGASSSFQLNPTPGSAATPEFQITSEAGGTAAVGLYGWINGSPWTIGSVTTSGNIQSASVSGVGQLFISDGSGALTGNVNWMTIRTDQSAGSVNASLAVNVTGLNYGGANVDLLALASSGGGSMNLTFQFNPSQTLGQLTAGSRQITSYSGSLTAASTSIPEPSTVVAGALLLLPFGISSVRILRKHKQTTL